MRIYEREDFKHLSQWVWIGFNKKNTLSIMNSGYPIIPIRFIICDKSEVGEAHQVLHETNEKSKVKGTFWYEFTDGPFFVGMFVNTIEYYITDKIIPEKISTLSYEEMLLIEKKYYFVTYNCKKTTWLRTSPSLGDWKFMDENTQTCQKLTDIHPIQFQLDCNEKYGQTEDIAYRIRNEYFVLNWIPVTEEEYNEYKDKIG